ncbi:MAG: excinuclease ABC subunit UvrC [Bifidobacterium aquikefiri]|uniref:excinuclease ABC subunit UvrC n=1 Tax=Bifidobacterium aquikefiri TaxID=1653207 RepID=UPI0039EBF596
MTIGFIERHSPQVWQARARSLIQSTQMPVTGSEGEGDQARKVNKNGAPLLGDTRDLFRPKTSDIPNQPGVYKWRDGEGRVIYVGKAKNLRNRLTNYFQPLYQMHPRTQTMVLTARSLEWTVVGTELESLTLEYTWIKEFDPRFNVVFRDDKTYPYLAMSLGNQLPRIWITRSRNRRNTRYFGPYAKVRDLRRTLDKLLIAFPISDVTPGVYDRSNVTIHTIDHELLTEYQRNQEKIIGIMTGRIGSRYLEALKAQMQVESEGLNFEKAARLRDQIMMLKTVIEQNAVVFDSNVDADVFGLASDELEASVHAFFVRSGAIRGERSWSVERVEDVSDEELVSDLITQVYSVLIEENESQMRNITPKALHAESEIAVQSETPVQSGEDTTLEQSDDDELNALADEFPAGYQSRNTGIAISRARDALGSTQHITATDAIARSKATRERHERQEMTGRADLLAPISPIPREVILPLIPKRMESLQTWLSDRRGSTVRLHVPERGEKKALLDRANANAGQSLIRSKMSRISDIGARTEAMNDVARALGLKQAPLRIECYDISNTIGGAFQVASMVVFEDAVAKKSEYRRFAIRGKDGNGAIDDTSAIYETLMRRFKHGNVAGDSGEDMSNEREIERAQESGERVAENTEGIVQQRIAPHRFAYKPNLIVVDGGKPQVAAAQRALNDSGITDVAVCGLAKKLEEVWIPDDDYPIILRRQSEGLYLLQRVRDESHRFAITYHRQKRRKGALRSELDDIPGIGASYQKRLLRYFGSVRAMKAASQEELCKVNGVGTSKAAAIFDALHKEDASGSPTVR